MFKEATELTCYIYDEHNDGEIGSYYAKVSRLGMTVYGVVGEVAGSSVQLATLAENLTEMVSHFKL